MRHRRRKVYLLKGNLFDANRRQCIYTNDALSTNRHRIHLRCHRYRIGKHGRDELPSLRHLHRRRRLYMRHDDMPPMGGLRRQPFVPQRLPPTNASQRRLCPMHHPLPRPKLRRRLGRRRRRILPLRRQKMDAPNVQIPPRPRRPMHRRIVPVRQPHLPTPHMVHVKRRLHHPRLTHPMRPKRTPKHSPGLA